jgi:hypothetical protein
MRMIGSQQDRVLLPVLVPAPSPGITDAAGGPAASIRGVVVRRVRARRA